MPFCPNCGTKVSEGARFCPECGHPLAVEGQTVKSKNKKRIIGIITACIVASVIVVILARSPLPPAATPSSPSHGIPLTVIRMNPQYWNTGHQEEALRIFGDKDYYDALDALIQACEDESWIGDELFELGEALCSINTEYHETHTYIQGEFDCNDMAVELWNILHKEGIVSLIVVGSLDSENETFGECNHSWLVVPYLLNPCFLVLEPTNGEVYSDERAEPYREGYYYTSPSDLRADIKERW